MNVKICLDFLKQLGKNNNREWFHANKPLYQEAKAEFELFINILIPRLKDVDSSIDVFHAKECTFRIFKDVRFSKDKSPYKTNFGAFISRGGRKSPFAGYYVHLEPNASFIGGGSYMPQAPQLKAIRADIVTNVEKYKKIISKAAFKKYFPEVYGEKLKTAPRGFDKTWPDIDLVRNKHYAVVHHVPDSFWFSGSTQDEIIKAFKVQVAFNDFLNGAIQKTIGR